MAGDAGVGQNEVVFGLPANFEWKRIERDLPLAIRAFYEKDHRRRGGGSAESECGAGSGRSFISWARSAWQCAQ